jgi:hypothetical protein
MLWYIKGNIPNHNDLDSVTETLQQESKRLPLCEILITFEGLFQAIKESLFCEARSTKCSHGLCAIQNWKEPMDEPEGAI